jgi:anti-sigma-K factor RskA
MSDFVRDLERELISAAHRRARQTRRVHWRPPAALATALVAVAVVVFALPSSPSRQEAHATVATADSCVFPDATLLLRDVPCTANPFRP